MRDKGRGGRRGIMIELCGVGGRWVERKEEEE